MPSLTGTQIVSEIEKLGHSARGYSETLDGGTGPNYYDCSGLIMTALTKLGVQGVPRDTQEQWDWLKKKNVAHNGTPNKDQLAIGDLVYATFAGDNMIPGHVGVYIGNGNMYSAQDEQAGIGIASLASWEQGGTINGWATIPGSTVSPNPGSTDTSGGGVTSWISLLNDPLGAAEDMLKVVEFLINPLSWLRIIAGMAGFVFLLAGLYMMAKAV